MFGKINSGFITLLFMGVSAAIMSLLFAPSTQSAQPSTHKHPNHPDPKPIIVAYYAGWAARSGHHIADIDASMLSHIIYAFANIGPDFNITFGDRSIDIDKHFSGDDPDAPFKGNFNQLLKLKEKHPHVKTLIGIGGWTWSGLFSDVALNDDRRHAFARSIASFVTKYGFDGVDIDWEYPVSGGLPDNIRRPEDKQNFTLLMKTIREHLDEQQAIDGKHYTLSFAAAAPSFYIENVDLSSLHRFVDFINLMAYDIHGPWDQKTGLLAPLFRDPESAFDSTWSVDDAVKSYIKEGVPKEKIIVGIPFYGYKYSGVIVNDGHSPTQHTPTLPRKTPSEGLHARYTKAVSVPYRIIANSAWKANNEYVQHATARVPYALTDTTFYTFENSHSISEKGAYIKQKQLGGAMIWEISQDTKDHELLRSLYDALK